MVEITEKQAAHYAELADRAQTTILVLATVYEALRAAEWGGTVIGCVMEGRKCCPVCEALAPVGDDAEVWDGYWDGAPARGEHFTDCEIATAIRLVSPDGSAAK
jgi:hypothetical protein